MESIIDTIQNRHSVRSYSNKPVENEKIKQIKEFLAGNTRGPFGNRVRFEIIDAAGYDKDQLKELGVYGIMKGAEQFIAGTVTKGEFSMEDYGFCMEKNILFATALGLGTCWMGGMLDRSTFAAKLHLADNEIIPAVTPIGYEHDKKTIGSQALELIMRSNKRKQFGEIVFRNNLNYPLEKSESGNYAKVLECVLLAPSAGNMQPWRIVKENGRDTYHLYQKENVSYNNNKRYEGSKLQNVDIGIAICHFELAAIEMGLNGRWEKSEPAYIIDGLNYITTWRGC